MSSSLSDPPAGVSSLHNRHSAAKGARVLHCFCLIVRAAFGTCDPDLNISVSDKGALLSAVRTMWVTSGADRSSGCLQVEKKHTSQGHVPHFRIATCHIPHVRGQLNVWLYFYDLAMVIAAFEPEDKIHTSQMRKNL